jgi:hypothetical protein
MMMMTFKLPSNTCYGFRSREYCYSYHNMVAQQ